MGGILESQSE